MESFPPEIRPDGNGRMGRMWHTALLGAWNPVFFWLPVDDLVQKNQQGYYDALGDHDALEHPVDERFLLLVGDGDAAGRRQAELSSRPLLLPRSFPAHILPLRDRPRRSLAGRRRRFLFRRVG